MLEESDFEGQTLLMHAASARSAPVFRVVHQTMAATLSNERQLQGKSCTTRKAPKSNLLKVRPGVPSFVRVPCTSRDTRHGKFVRDGAPGIP